MFSTSDLPMERPLLNNEAHFATLNQESRELDRLTHTPDLVALNTLRDRLDSIKANDSIFYESILDDGLSLALVFLGEKACCGIDRRLFEIVHDDLAVNSEIAVWKHAGSRVIDIGRIDHLNKIFEIKFPTYQVDIRHRIVRIEHHPFDLHIARDKRTEMLGCIYGYPPHAIEQMSARENRFLGVEDLIGLIGQLSDQEIFNQEQNKLCDNLDEIIASKDSEEIKLSGLVDVVSIVTEKLGIPQSQNLDIATNYYLSVGINITYGVGGSVWADLPGNKFSERLEYIWTELLAANGFLNVIEAVYL